MTEKDINEIGLLLDEIKFIKRSINKLTNENCTISLVSSERLPNMGVGEYRKESIMTFDKNDIRIIKQLLENKLEALKRKILCIDSNFIFSK